MRGRKFFRRIFVGQAAILLFHMISFSIISFAWTKYVVVSQNNLENRHVAEQASAKISEVVNGINLIAQSLLESQSLKEYASSSTSPYTGKLLYDDLAEYREQCRFFRAELGFSTLRDNNAVSIHGTWDSLTSYFNYLGVTSSGEELLRQFSQEPGHSYVVIDSDTKLIVVTRYMPVINRYVYAFTIFEKEYLLDNFNENEDYIFNIYDGQRTVMEHSSTGELPDRTDLLSRAAQGKRWNGRPLYSGEIGANWTYVCSVSDQGSRRSMNLSLVGSLTIVLLVESIGIAVIYLTTKRIYQPFANFMEVFGFESSGNHDELQHAISTYTELWRKNVEIEDAVVRIKEYSRNKVLEDLLGGSVSARDAEEIIGANGFDIFDKRISIAHVSVSSSQGSFSPDAMRVMRDQLMSEIAELMKAENIQYECFPADDRVFWILTTVYGKKLEQIVAQGQETCQMLKMDRLGVSVICLIDEPVFGIEEASEKYKRMLASVDLLAPSQRFYYLKDLPENMHPDFYYPIETEREMIMDVIAGNHEAAVQCLEKILDVNLQMRMEMVNIVFLKMLMQGTMIRIIHTAKLQNSVMAGNYLGRIKESGSLLEFKQTVAEIFRDISEKITSNVSDGNKEIIDEMIEYIHANLNRDFGMIELQERYNLSQSYISSLFKQYVGISFKDYVNSEKVKLAVRMLEENPDIKVYELAKQLGFNSADTLIRVFKKYTGETPGKYVRNRNQDQE